MPRKTVMIIVVEATLTDATTLSAIQKVFNVDSIVEGFSSSSDLRKETAYLVRDSELRLAFKQDMIPRSHTVMTIREAMDVVYENSLSDKVTQSALRSFIALAQRAGDAMRGLHCGLMLGGESLDLPILNEFTKATGEMARLVKDNPHG